jgi:hypothetical protein
LISAAKATSGLLFDKYFARAVVVVPLLVALRFATAATTLMLVNRFGYIVAFWIIAGGFTLIGSVATRVVADKENKADIAEKQAGAHDTGATTQAAVQVAVQVLMTLAVGLLSTPRGPGTIAAGAKMLVRNMPLVVLLARLAFLFWPSGSESDADAANPMECQSARLETANEGLILQLHRAR